MSDARVAGSTILFHMVEDFVIKVSAVDGVSDISATSVKLREPPGCGCTGTTEGLGVKALVNIDGSSSKGWFNGVFLEGAQLEPKAIFSLIGSDYLSEIEVDSNDFFDLEQGTYDGSQVVFTGRLVGKSSGVEHILLMTGGGSGKAFTSTVSGFKTLDTAVQITPIIQEGLLLLRASFGIGSSELVDHRNAYIATTLSGVQWSVSAVFRGTYVGRRLSDLVNRGINPSDSFIYLVVTIDYITGGNAFHNGSLNDYLIVKIRISDGEMVSATALATHYPNTDISLQEGPRVSVVDFGTDLGIHIRFGDNENRIIEVAKSDLVDNSTDILFDSPPLSWSSIVDAGFVVSASTRTCSSELQFTKLTRCNDPVSGFSVDSGLPTIESRSDFFIRKSHFPVRLHFGSVAFDTGLDLKVDRNGMVCLNQFGGNAVSLIRLDGGDDINKSKFFSIKFAIRFDNLRSTSVPDWMDFLMPTGQNFAWLVQTPSNAGRLIKIGSDGDPTTAQIFRYDVNGLQTASYTLRRGFDGSMVMSWHANSTNFGLVFIDDNFNPIKAWKFLFEFSVPFLFPPYIVPLPDGYFVIGSNLSGDDKAILLRIDFDGNILWAKRTKKKLTNTSEFVSAGRVVTASGAFIVTFLLFDDGTSGSAVFKEETMEIDWTLLRSGVIASSGRYKLDDYGGRLLISQRGLLLEVDLIERKRRKFELFLDEDNIVSTGNYGGFTVFDDLLYVSFGVELLPGQATSFGGGPDVVVCRARDEMLIDVPGQGDQISSPSPELEDINVIIEEVGVSRIIDAGGITVSESTLFDVGRLSLGRRKS